MKTKHRDTYHTMRCPSAPLKRTITIYATAMLAGFVLISLLAYVLSARFTPSSSGELFSKYLHVAQAPGQYDLLFLGDSRAFCAVQPEKIDQILGTRSFNLAHWTNWLPTQYPMASDLAPQLPKPTTVVMFVGHVNFQGEAIYDKFPIGLGRVTEYLDLGFTPAQMYDNLASFNPLLRFFHKRGAIRTIIENSLDRPWLTFSSAPSLTDPSLSSQTVKRALALSKLPAVQSVEILKDKGRTTSLALHKKNGAYERVELDNAFFRDKQTPRNAQNKPRPPSEPDSRYLALYRRILDIFQSAGVHLVIVELEEAPHVYGTPQNREKWRGFLRSFARPIARAHGFPYLVLPLETIPDSGYFDYDHMNSKGIALFTPMLAKALAPYVGKDGEAVQ